MITDRTAAYFIRSAKDRTSDPLEFQRRYLVGLQVQLRLYEVKVKPLAGATHSCDGGSGVAEIERLRSVLRDAGKTVREEDRTFFDAEQHAWLVSLADRIEAECAK